MYWPVPVVRRSGRIETYGTANRTQNLQGEAASDACSRARVGYRALALPRSVQYGLRTPHHCLPAPPCFRLTLRAGSGVEGDTGGVSGVRRHPQPRLARCAGPARQDLSGVLSPSQGWGEGGLPRFKGRNRFHSFTFKEYGSGATLDHGLLVLSKIGRIAVHWSRPIEGTPKTITISKEADGWYVAMSCAAVPIH